MQKKLIALAVAGLASSAAFAQTNVTMYGKIDMSYEASQGSNSTKTQGINSGGHDGSRLGFRGSEALGGGMKAIFGLEYQLRTDVNGGVGNVPAGQGGAQSRETYVGLEAGWGQVKFGRVYSAGDNFGGKYDSLDAANSYSPLQYFAGSIGSMITTGAVSNAVAYKSAPFYGVTVRSYYGFGNATTGTDSLAYTNKGTNNQQRNYGTGLDFDKGPLSVGFVYAGSSDVGNQSGINQKEWAFAGTYDFGMAAPYGTYQGLKTQGLGGLTTSKWELWSLGVTVPVTKADLIRFMYSTLDNKLPLSGNRGASSWGALVEHSLSKRTMAYVGYNNMNNDRGTNSFVTPVGNGNAGSSNVTSNFGSTTSGYGFGMIHNF